jgi:16S rRNA (cytosine967-C5)-methyltransferase
VAELAELQIRLLESALAALAPGGILAYVTCSPHPAETRAVVQSALRVSGGGSAGDVHVLDTPAVLAQVTREKLELPPGDHVQLWPHRHGTDAMFIQLLART